MSIEEYAKIKHKALFFDGKEIRGEIIVNNDYTVTVTITLANGSRIYERRFRDLVQLSTFLEKSSNLFNIIAAIRTRGKISDSSREPAALVQALRDTVYRLLSDTSLLPEAITSLIKKAYSHLNLYRMIEVTAYRIRIMYGGKQAYTDLIPREEYSNVMLDIAKIIGGDDNVTSSYTSPLIPLLVKMRDDGLTFEEAYMYINIEFEPIAYFFVGSHGELIFSDKRLPPTVDSYSLVPLPQWFRDKIRIYTSYESLKQIKRVAYIKMSKKKDESVDFFEMLLDNSYYIIRGVVGTEYRKLLELFNEIKKVLFDEEVVDPDLALIYKGYVIPSYRPQEMFHGIIATNPGVGKSTLASIIGEVIDNATGVSLMGTVESLGHGQYKEVPSILHGRNYLHQIEDMEAPKSGWDYGPIFNYFISGVINRYVRGHVVKSYATASLVFTMNVDNRIMATLDKFLVKWGSNTTGIARRMDLFVFGEDFQRPKVKLSDEFKIRAKAVVKLLQLSDNTRILWYRLLRKAEQWLNEEAEPLPFDFEPKENPANDMEQRISSFLAELSAFDDQRLRYHSIRAALVDYLLEYYDGKVTEDQIIDKAKEYYQRLRILRLKSMNRLKMYLQGLSFGELLLSASDVLQLILKKVAEAVIDGSIKPEYGVVEVSYDDIMFLLQEGRWKRRAKDFLRDTFIRGKSMIQRNIARQLGIDVFHERTLKSLKLRIPQTLIDYMVELVKQERGEENE